MKAPIHSTASAYWLDDPPSLGTTASDNSGAGVRQIGFTWWLVACQMDRLSVGVTGEIIPRLHNLTLGSGAILVFGWRRCSATTGPRGGTNALWWRYLTSGGI